MNMKSVLMIGQSNMAGRGYLSDVPAIYNENIQMLRNGRWQMMAEPINCDKPVAGVSLAGSFAAMWAMEHPGEKIGLIPCAEGGSSIDEWHPTGTLFKHAVSEARFAMEESELIAILWHQGENDSFGGCHRTYYDKLKQIVDTLRDELGLPDIPFILGGLGDFLEHARLGADCREYREINRELKRFAADFPQKQTSCIRWKMRTNCLTSALTAGLTARMKKCMRSCSGSRPAGFLMKRPWSGWRN